MNVYVSCLIIINNVVINIFVRVFFCIRVLSFILFLFWFVCVWVFVYGGCCGWIFGGWVVEEEEAMLSGVFERFFVGVLGGFGWLWEVSLVFNVRFFLVSLINKFG